MSHGLTILLDRKSEQQLHCCSREVVIAKNEDRLPFHRLEEGHESLCCLCQCPSVARRIIACVCEI